MNTPQHHQPAGSVSRAQSAALRIQSKANNLRGLLPQLNSLAESVAQSITNLVDDWPDAPAGPAAAGLAAPQAGPAGRPADAPAAAAAEALLQSMQTTAHALVSLLEAVATGEGHLLPAAEDLARLQAYRAAAGIELLGGVPQHADSAVAAGLVPRLLTPRRPTLCACNACEGGAA